MNSEREERKESPRGGTLGREGGSGLGEVWRKTGGGKGLFLEVQGDLQARRSSRRWGWLCTERWMMRAQQHSEKGVGNTCKHTCGNILSGRLDEEEGCPAEVRPFWECSRRELEASSSPRWRFLILLRFRA